jgi:hypothetical protein
VPELGNLVARVYHAFLDISVRVLPGFGWCFGFRLRHVNLAEPCCEDSNE